VLQGLVSIASSEPRLAESHRTTILIFPELLRFFRGLPVLQEGYDTLERSLPLIPMSYCTGLFAPAMHRAQSPIARAYVRPFQALLYPQNVGFPGDVEMTIYSRDRLRLGEVVPQSSEPFPDESLSRSMCHSQA